MKRIETLIRFTLIISLMIICIRFHAQALIPYYDNGKYGYADAYGEIRIEPIYDYVEFFVQNNLAVVKKESTQFFINKLGEELISFSEKVKPRLSVVTNYDNKPYSIYTSSQDTIQNLRLILLNNQKFQFINISTYEVSSVFEKDRKSKILVGFRPQESIHFEKGYLIGRTLLKDYEILNKNGKVIKRTNKKPTIWSAELISYPKGDSTVLFNPVNEVCISIPYRSIAQIVVDKYLIVSNRSEDNGLFLNLKDNNNKKGMINMKGNIILDTIYQDLKFYNHENIIATKEDSYFINFAGNPITDNRYKSIYPLNQSVYIGEYADKSKTLINAEGIDLELGRFDKISYLPHENYYTWKESDMAGILDSNLNLVIEYQADFIYSSDKNFFIVKKESKTGVINIEKKIVIPIEYDECYLTDKFFFALINGDKKGLANLNGDILFQPEYDEIIIESNRDQIFFIPRKNDLYTCYDLELNQLFGNSSKRYKISNRSVNWYHSNGTYHFTNEYGISLNINGKHFNSGYTMSDSTLIVVVYEENTIKDVIVENDSLFQAKRNNADLSKINIGAGLFGIYKEGLQGVINHVGEVILPLTNREIIEISSRYIITKENTKYYLYKLNGDLIYAKGFDFVSHSPTDGIRAVGNNIEGKKYEFIRNACIYGKEDTIIKNHRNYGYLDVNGEILVPLEYNRTIMYFDKFACVTKGFVDGEKRSFLVDTLGNIVLKTSYDDLYPLNHTDQSGHYIAKRNGKKGLINFNGEIVIPFEYNAIQGFHELDIISARDFNNNWHLLSLKNEKLFSGNHFHIDGQYEQCIELPENKYLFFPNGRSEIIDLNGKSYLKYLSQDVNLFKLPNLQLIEVRSGDYQYYINAKSLIEYKSTSD